MTARGGARERDVVARPRSARTALRRRAPAAKPRSSSVAATSIARSSEPPTIAPSRATRARAPAGGSVGAGALRLGKPLGVGGEQGDHARGERGGERRAVGEAVKTAQQLVGSTTSPASVVMRIRSVTLSEMSAP